ncbi:DNA damage-binding protein 2 isoform X2 [Erinaceus europaeus]|uniref:DNA damage-binding protein 2 n=1 Tax=Erinaceus europaeus TaxID=9365 RepID=A0ABM3W7C3_ERIEU|nr:DNA damage-binding protein 2 isoform X2 [Erinaceus europaeus]
MAPKRRPETQKIPELVVRPKSKRNRSPGEPEPEAKHLCVKRPGSSRRFGSSCPREGLARLQVPPPCSCFLRALHRHRLGQSAPPALQQIGAGGSITGMKFNPLNANQFFTSSMEGTTRLQDFKGNTLRVFTSSTTCNLWYCSLDVSAQSRVVVTGDNLGNVILLNMDGKELWNLKIHKRKVTHVALHPSCDWFLATASVDQTVKIWDLRQIKGKSSFLYSLPHRQGVNAASFSPDGARLLTTDQKSEIRVYSASQWDSPPSLIPHPHRHFQHLTPIKASWHPRHNLIVVGRYPDPNFENCTPYELRTIDMFDGSSGKMMYQLYDPESNGIISLSEFSPMGDTLASVMGYHVLIWSQDDAGR